MTIEPKYGPLVRELRLLINLGLREFAEKCGIKPGDYANIESGRRRATTEDRAAIARVLQVRGGGLISGLLWEAAERPMEFEHVPEGMIPVFIKTTDGRRLSEQEVESLRNHIQSIGNQAGFTT